MEGRRSEDAGAKNSSENARMEAPREEEMREVVVVENVGSMSEGGRESVVKASVWKSEAIIVFDKMIGREAEVLATLSIGITSILSGISRGKDNARVELRCHSFLSFRKGCAVRAGHVA